MIQAGKLEAYDGNSEGKGGKSSNSYHHPPPPPPVSQFKSNLNPTAKWRW